MSKWLAVVCTLEGKEAIQAWEVELCEHPCFQQVQVQGPALSWGNPKHKYRLGREWLRAALWRRTWNCWWMRTLTWTNNVHWQPWKPIISRAVSKEEWPAGWERWFPLLLSLSWRPAWSSTLGSGPCTLRRTWTCWSEFKGGSLRWSESWSKGWTTSPVKTGWWIWCYSAWRRLEGDHIAPSST